MSKFKRREETERRDRERQRETERQRDREIESVRDEFPLFFFQKRALEAGTHVWFFPGTRSDVHFSQPCVVQTMPSAKRAVGYVFLLWMLLASMHMIHRTVLNSGASLSSLSSASSASSSSSSSSASAAETSPAPSILERARAALQNVMAGRAASAAAAAAAAAADSTFPVSAAAAAKAAAATPPPVALPLMQTSPSFNQMLPPTTSALAAAAVVDKEATTAGSESAGKLLTTPPPPPPAPAANNASSAHTWKPFLRSEHACADNDCICFKKFSEAGFLERTDVYVPKGVSPASPSAAADAADRSSVECHRNAGFGQSDSICVATNMLLDTTMISCSQGGEDILSVANRAEDAEYPTYQEGAFGLAGCERRDNPFTANYMRDVVNSGFGVVGDSVKTNLGCERWVEEPTIFITRYEYCNLYHTNTDWFNVFVTLSFAGLLETRGINPENGAAITRARPHHIVWLDGHAKGSLDSAWKEMFGSLSVMRVFEFKGSRTCFRKAYFAPAGYSSAVNKYSDGCHAPQGVAEFSNFVLNAYALLETTPMDPKRVAFAFREPFLAHPRNPTGSITRFLENRIELESAMKQSSSPSSVGFDGATLPLKQQLENVRRSKLLVGLHGAGLTLVMFMHPGSKLLEIAPPDKSGEPHFVLYPQWCKDIGYERIHGLDSVGSQRYRFSPERLSSLIRENL